MYSDSLLSIYVFELLCKINFVDYNQLVSIGQKSPLEMIEFAYCPLAIRMLEFIEYCSTIFG
jgi:hypothetical protein